MLHLANPNLAPPGSFKLRWPALAAINAALANLGPFHALKDLEDELHRRCVANGITPPSDAEVQDALCQGLPPGTCRDESNLPALGPGAFHLTLADIAQGTATLLSWWRNGRRRVPDEEAVRRAYICNAPCPWHVPIHGCTGCSGGSLRALVNEIVASRPLPTDAMLGGCGVCRCSLPAKTRMLAEDVLPHMTPHQREHLWEKCWLRDPPQASAT